MKKEGELGDKERLAELKVLLPDRIVVLSAVVGLRRFKVLVISRLAGSMPFSRL